MKMAQNGARDGILFVMYEKTEQKPFSSYSVHVYVIIGALVFIRGFRGHDLIYELVLKVLNFYVLRLLGSTLYTPLCFRFFVHFIGVAKKTKVNLMTVIYSLWLILHLFFENNHNPLK